MSAQAAAARGRARAKTLLGSTCTVFTSGEPTTDPNTGQVTRAKAVVYTGPCKVRPALTGLTALSDDIGGGETFRFDYRVSLPFEEDGVIEGMRLTVTSCPDPSMVGLTLEVQRIDRGDFLTARRLICNKVS
jgi:hypothetical protein